MAFTNIKDPHQHVPHNLKRYYGLNLKLYINGEALQLNCENLQTGAGLYSIYIHFIKYRALHVKCCKTNLAVALVFSF